MGEPSLGARLFICVIIALDPRREEVGYPSSHRDADFELVTLITPALDADIREVVVNRSPRDEWVFPRPVQGGPKMDVRPILRSHSTRPTDGAGEHRLSRGHFDTQRARADA
jgi:hypothetical protein